jgi:hypothetical protein
MHQEKNNIFINLIAIIIKIQCLRHDLRLYLRLDLRRRDLRRDLPPLAAALAALALAVLAASLAAVTARESVKLSMRCCSSFCACVRFACMNSACLMAVSRLDASLCVSPVPECLGGGTLGILFEIGYNIHLHNILF